MCVFVPPCTASLDGQQSQLLRASSTGPNNPLCFTRSSLQGMPFKWYQGKTGVVWNVTKRALGVEINKRVCVGQAGV